MVSSIDRSIYHITSGFTPCDIFLASYVNFRPIVFEILCRQMHGQMHRQTDVQTNRHHQKQYLLAECMQVMKDSSLIIIASNGTKQKYQTNPSQFNLHLDVTVSCWIMVKYYITNKIIVRWQLLDKHNFSWKKTNPPVSLEGLMQWRRWCRESCWNWQRTCADHSQAARHATLPTHKVKVKVQTLVLALLTGKPTSEALRYGMHCKGVHSFTCMPTHFTNPNRMEGWVKLVGIDGLSIARWSPIQVLTRLGVD